MQPDTAFQRSPGLKLILAIVIAMMLTVPLFAIYLLVYDRQHQSDTARSSIAQGWGGPQALIGPLLAIPYQAQTTTTETVDGKQVSKTRIETRELLLSPETADIVTKIAPEVRKRSIYEAVVYGAHTAGRARFALPADLQRYGVAADKLQLDRAELRFGVSDPRGLYGAPPKVTVDGAARSLQPGKGPGETNGAGFYTWLDATVLTTKPMTADFAFDLRGNASLALVPRAGDTRWAVTSPWPNPSFQGGFLPTDRHVAANGFTATYRVGNLALGRTLVDTSDTTAALVVPVSPGPASVERAAAGPQAMTAQVDLVTPVDLYDQVNRSVKYGFLFIGFTFMAFLMFDVVGGVRVATVEYLLVGAGLILFFVMLLAFAEVIGFTLAYLVAAGAIVALLTAYSAAVLKSRRRAGFILGLLVALYAVLYILLSLEAYSLLIGSLLLFAALAAVMFLTRNIDWGRVTPPVPV
jgi:inner membrane protein